MSNPIERVQRFPVRAPQPAAGADWALTPTGLGTWRILSLTATLVTSAAVATRAVALTADDQTLTWFRVPAAATQAASLTVHYDAFDGSHVTTGIGTDEVIDWPRGGLVLPQGHTLRSVTTAIDAADQWSNIVALVEELPSGAFYYTSPVEPYQVEQW